MFKKTLLITALGASAISLSGCSSMWSAASVFSSDMAEITKFTWLRGKSKTSDIGYAENNIDPETGVYKTDVGEYIPQESFVDTAAVSPDFADYSTDAFAASVDTSQLPCPDGTYLAEDNSCMSLDTESYDFAGLEPLEPAPFIDLSQHECPEDTYLNDKNACMYFETETFDFEDDNSAVALNLDTSPLACPEDTYLTAEGSCMYLENDITDFSQNTMVVPAADITATDVTFTGAALAPTLRTAPVEAPLAAPLAAPANAFAANLSAQCPEGFVPNFDSCMYVGAGK